MGYDIKATTMTFGGESKDNGISGMSKAQLEHLKKTDLSKYMELKRKMRE